MAAAAVLKTECPNGACGFDPHPLRRTKQMGLPAQGRIPRYGFSANPFPNLVHLCSRGAVVAHSVVSRGVAGSNPVESASNQQRVTPVRAQGAHLLKPSSSSGPGRRPFKACSAGSNPVEGAGCVHVHRTPKEVPRFNT